MMKNMLNRKLSLILCLLLFTSFVCADIPPDRDEMMNVSDLQVKPTDEFADYRFFLLYGSDLEEITVKKDVPVIIEGDDRNGQRKYARFIALPKSVLQGDVKLTDDQERKLVDSIYKDENKDFIQLLEHRFKDYIKTDQRVNQTYPVYELRREGNLPKAVPMQPVSRKISDEEEAIITSAKYEKATIIGGILLTLAVLLIGVYLFRRA
jgi:hypothetical protein